jgi:hypothetical protein
MRKRVLLAAAGTMVLAAVLPASTAVAGTVAGTTHPTAATHTVAGPAANDPHRAVVIAGPTAVNAGGKSAGSVSALASSAPTCWTAFAPPVPQGIAMYQYYRNCNGYGLRVYPGFRDPSTGAVISLGNCTWISDGYYIFWYFNTTYMNVDYGTYTC